jgi:hypothetical protein
VRIRHFSKGRFYLIQCPRGTRVVRCWGHPEAHDLLVVPFEGREIRIPADPSELLPLLAESGRCGLLLIGDPEREMRLAGVPAPTAARTM